VIHADRVRDLERAAREHRLLAAADEQRPDHAVGIATGPGRTSSDPRGRSARVPA
jgi:hypothetical protein